MLRDHTPPHIDYTVRDFAGFRRLLLDHLAVLAPGWAERAAADLGIAVVDVLAYVADYMSYYQDAVATEAYLGTARLRRSVRRHARLLDYNLHDGTNARLWLTVEVEADCRLPAGTQAFAGGEGLRPREVVRVGSRDHGELLGQAAAVVFETMHPATLRRAHNELSFAPSATDMLDAGATSARLRGEHGDLRAGDVLIFEEVRGAISGRPADADPAHRHALRLTWARAEGGETRVEWGDEDRLPFALVTRRSFGGQEPLDVCVARGNVVLADHGRTAGREELPPIPRGERYRPRLRLAGLAFAEPYDHLAARAGRSAAATLAQRPDAALPAIDLVELSLDPLERDGGPPLVPTLEHPPGSGRVYAVKPWLLRGTLLSSGTFQREYLVEMEEDGVAYLRFGFAEAGWQPSTIGATMLATYRVGNGPDGNVGHDSVVSIAVAPEQESHVRRARNPLAAAGGTAPRETAAARLHAPHAYRVWEPPEVAGAPGYAPQAYQAQERCVTLEDYASVAARHPEVDQAVAQTSWTGRSQQVVVYVSRRDGAPRVGRAFHDELCAFLDPYRPAGATLAVAPPRFIPVDLRVRAQLRPGHSRAVARSALLRALSGPDGFFAPAAFGFGQPVHRSRLVARLAALPGVAWVDLPRFRRKGAAGDEEHIAMGPFEIARLDPAFLAALPDAITIEGGL